LYNFEVVRVQRKLNFILRELYSLFILFKLIKNVDLVFANGHFFKSLMLCKIFRIKFIAKIVGDYSWERAQNRGWTDLNIDNFQTSKKSIFLKLLDWASKYPIRKASNVIVPSYYLKNLISKFWAVPSNNISVIYNSFNPSNNEETYILSPREFKYRAIAINRLVPWKRMENVISAIQYCQDVELIIIGEGPEKQKLINLANNLGLTKKVNFFGQISKKYIHSIIGQCDFFILNSSYEGLPHVVLESVWAQTPVLATNVGGTSESFINGKEGILIEMCDPIDLSKKITEITREIESFVFEKNNFLEKFSMEKMLTSTEHLLKLNIGD
jgi:glycosyltransferase involved in cell wall biosynthesis